MEQQNQQLSVNALPPPPRSPRRKKLDSTDSADSTASSNSVNGGERSNGRVGGRGGGRGVRPPVPVLTLPLPASGQVGWIKKDGRNYRVTGQIGKNLLLTYS